MSTVPSRPVRILFAGPFYLGSHSGAMARALKRAGQVVHVVDPRQFVPTVKSSLPLRIIRRSLTRLFEREFNDQLVRDLHSFEPELMVVYKGESVMPKTILTAQAAGVCCINVYPDLSIFTHGPWIPQCLPLYDHVFSTKSFAADDLRQHLGLTSVTFLPHGFDPDVHCPLSIEEPRATLSSDVSFIGTRSPKKERLLTAIATAAASLNFKIWGAQWAAASSSCLRRHAMGKDVFGPIYAMAVQQTRINLGILSEASGRASSGDLITSRTFNIPACGGFLLHERTTELTKFFTEGEEVSCFSDGSELVDRIHYYLAHDDERERIRIAGHRRCVRENSIDARAQVVLQHYHSWRASRNSTPTLSESNRINRQ